MEKERGQNALFGVDEEMGVAGILTILPGTWKKGFFRHNSPFRRSATIHDEDGDAHLAGCITAT